jgi:hypothetical protein
MKPQQAALWAFVLLASLGLIFALMISRRERPTPPPAPTDRLPTETPWALVSAPTRLPPTVAVLPSATPLLLPSPPTSALIASPLPPLGAQPTDAPKPLDLPVDEVYRISIPQPAAPRARLSARCPKLGMPISLRLFDWDSGQTTNLSDAEIAQIPLGWDASANLWQGYESLHPFNQPDDAKVRWSLNLYLPDGVDHWIVIYTSATTPATYYTYAFDITQPYTINGEHLGNHPCSAFAIPGTWMNDFLNVIRQYQNIVAYPPFISGSDPRWKRGTAGPTGAYADLRSIPSKANNNPIGGLDRSVPVWYAVDPTWDGWAQVRIGSVQGWVDTSTVALMPDG